MHCVLSNAWLAEDDLPVPLLQRSMTRRPHHYRRRCIVVRGKRGTQSTRDRGMDPQATVPEQNCSLLAVLHNEGQLPGRAEM